MSTQISMSVSVRQIVVCTEEEQDEAEYTEGCKGGDGLKWSSTIALPQIVQ